MLTAIHFYSTWQLDLGLATGLFRSLGNPSHLLFLKGSQPASLPTQKKGEKNPKTPSCPCRLCSPTWSLATPCGCPCISPPGLHRGKGPCRLGGALQGALPDMLTHCQAQLHQTNGSFENALPVHSLFSLLATPNSPRLYSVSLSLLLLKL